MSRLLPLDGLRKQSSTNALQENDQPRKRLETIYQTLKGKGTKTELGADVLAETNTERGV